MTSVYRTLKEEMKRSLVCQFRACTFSHCAVPTFLYCLVLSLFHILAASPSLCIKIGVWHKDDGTFRCPLGYFCILSNFISKLDPETADTACYLDFTTRETPQTTSWQPRCVADKPPWHTGFVCNISTDRIMTAMMDGVTGAQHRSLEREARWQWGRSELRHRSAHAHPAKDDSERLVGAQWRHLGAGGSPKD